MKTICKLTDKEILGTDGLSDANPRITARAIMKNPAGLYAVIHTKRHDFYMLPGGGVERGEDVVAALKREVLEETGCTCDEIYELGCVYENRACLDFTQIDHYFVVNTYSYDSARLNLTESELRVGTEVEWHTIEDIQKLVAAAENDTPQQKYLRARDLAALEEYRKNFKPR